MSHMGRQWALPPVRPLRRKQADEWAGSKLLGIHLCALDDAPARQNFAVLNPSGPAGSALFIHGRELFSQEGAQRYFSEHPDAKQQGETLFNETAKQRVRDYFSPRGLAERLYDYGDVKNYTQVVNGFLRDMKARYTHVDFSNLPPVDEQNAYEVENRVRQRLEEGGVDLHELEQSSLRMSKEEEEKLRSQRRIICARLMGALPGLDSHLHDALSSYVEAHDWDPEILYNFRRGLDIDTQHLPLEKLLEIGIERRVIDLLHLAAGQMSNPYERDFLKAEKHVASILVQSVQPRVLRDAMRHHTPVITTDANDLSPLHSIMGYDRGCWKDAAGAFHRIRGGRGNPASYIILSALERAPSLGSLAAHEFEHHRDLTQTSPFAGLPKETLQGWIAKDREHLARLCGLVRSFDPDHSSSDQRAEMARLLGKFKFSDRVKGIIDMLEREHPDWNIGKDPTLGLNYLSDDIDTIRDATARFMDPRPENRHYRTRYAQTNEIPAVIIQLKHQVGAPLLRECLPHLYEAVMKQRLQKPDLRDNLPTR